MFKSVILKKLSINSAFYFVHSISPIFHSKSVPKTSNLKINIRFHIIFVFIKSFWRMGIIKVISISKIMNSMAIIKNCPEINVFLYLWDSNPHSKFDDFSLEFICFFNICLLKNNKMIVKDRLKIIIINKFIRQCF